MYSILFSRISPRSHNSIKKLAVEVTRQSISREEGRILLRSFILLFALVRKKSYFFWKNCYLASWGTGSAIIVNRTSKLTAMAYLSSSAAKYTLNYFVNSGMKEKLPYWAKSDMEILLVEEADRIDNEDIPRATELEKPFSKIIQMWLSNWVVLVTVSFAHHIEQCKNIQQKSDFQKYVLSSMKNYCSCRDGTEFSISHAASDDYIGKKPGTERRTIPWHLILNNWRELEKLIISWKSFGWCNMVTESTLIKWTVMK